MDTTTPERKEATEKEKSLFFPSTLGLRPFFCFHQTVSRWDGEILLGVRKEGPLSLTHNVVIVVQS